MTKDIVQSDIDMTRRLLDARRPTAEILDALLRRGISQPVALRLIMDLQAGRTVTPQLPLPERIRHEAAASSPVEQQDAAGNDEIEELPAFPPPPRAKVPGRLSRVLFLVVLAISLVGGGWYYGYHLKAHILLMELQQAADEVATASLEGKEAKLKEANELRGFINQWHYLDSREISVLKRIEGRLNVPEPGSATNAPPESIPAGKVDHLTIKLGRGLLLQGENLTRTNALALLNRVLGPPTRSKRGRDMDIVFTYDRHGLLYYDAPDNQRDFLLIDFDGVGGDNGTTAPFTATLEVEGTAIRSDTNAKVLLAIKALGLSDPGGEGGILGGRYHDLDLIFAYFKSSGHLNSLQIKLP